MKCIYFVSFFDRHFITGGTLNTTPPLEERLEKYETPTFTHTLMVTTAQGEKGRTARGSL